MEITKEQIDALNQYQNNGKFHPFTCLNDGDEKHIMYEFNQYHPNENYDEYIDEQKKIVNFPGAEFTQTNLIATEKGWVCPVCDYKQPIKKESVEFITTLSKNS